MRMLYKYRKRISGRTTSRREPETRQGRAGVRLVEQPRCRGKPLFDVFVEYAKSGR